MISAYDVKVKGRFGNRLKHIKPQDLKDPAQLTEGRQKWGHQLVEQAAASSSSLIPAPRSHPCSREAWRESRAAHRVKVLLFKPLVPMRLSSLMEQLAWTSSKPA